jgi:hypothetical protein
MFESGVIEGFYGKQWSWQRRSEYAAFLSGCGLGFYIYAPKGDAFLRRRWMEAWPDSHYGELHALRQTYKDQSVSFGIGFSPLGLVESFNAENKARLADKLAEINALSPDIFCLLFDDMPGDNKDLASIQLAISEFVFARVKAKRGIVCPSYYSIDPVLEKVFGTRPTAYWEDLGKGLDPSLDIFWTGNQVISPAIMPEDLVLPSDVFRRPVFLWDNYPVNDGRLSSNFLNLLPFSGRPPVLSSLCSGHAANPMNAAALSQISLVSLAQNYLPLSSQPLSCESSVASGASLESCLAYLEVDRLLAHCLLEDAERFQYQGLSSLQNELPFYLQRYRVFSDPLALEVIDWLQGHYCFDPECLTD